MTTNGSPHTTKNPQLETAGPRRTPDLIGGFRALTQTTAEPMSAERRAELVEELIAWADDPDGADWEYLKKLS